MRICFISSEYPPETGFGGIGTYTRIMAQGLSEKGHDVTVIALSERENGYETADGRVKVIRVSSGRYPLPQGKLFWRLRMLAYRYIPHSLIRMAFASSVAEAFAKLTAERPFDIVEAADCGAESYYLKLSKSTKLIIRLHTPYSFSLKFNSQGIGRIDRKKLEIMEKRCCRGAYCITSPSEALAIPLIREWDLKKVEVFPNPLDFQNMPAIFPDSDGKNCITYTGRLEYRKGVHLLIKAYAELKKHGITEKLLIIGRAFGESGIKGKKYGDLIRDLIKKYQIAESVEWIEGLSREELLKNLNRTKVAVFPAVWDNYPYACLEMMASGIPVVAYKTGGFPEIIRDGVDGLLAKALDYKELSIKLAELLKDSEKAKFCANSAKKRVLDLCSISEIVKKNEDVYCS